MIMTDGRKYRMLALDLDGTLLMPDLTIPDAVRRGIGELIDRGVIVTLSTGRMYPTAARYAEELGIKYPLICYNGAVLRACGETAVYAEPVPLDVQRQVIELCEDRGWYVQLYNDDKIITAISDEHTRRDLDTLENRVLEVGRLSKAELKPSPKLTSKCLDGAPEERLRIIKEELGGRANVTLSGGDVIEITNRSVSKAYAVKTLCRMYGIDIQDTVACGDSENDLEMLRAAGLGCAMGNAVPELKKISGYVCKMGYSFGVLEAIERFF